MCGRFTVNHELAGIVSSSLKIPFQVQTSLDLCPSQTVASIIFSDEGPTQLNARWGIQPSWAKRLLINAQVEGVSQKPTFRDAYRQHRCLIPLSGWYEWRVEGKSKVKYLFRERLNTPLLMAGVYFASEESSLVSLTTEANQQAKPYHQRMPYLFPLDEGVEEWINRGNLEYKPTIEFIIEPSSC